ncbi:hypothetical protein EVAR_86549_1 [Eumeta japonica]|uniref:Uncharacterized protein n=1 Tax=Eumeta variegata TaxID=151549 RepID=A0A4C1ZJB1_EUMVA|nr:hypothetical protein EVAR_86549_1 [Eumeta japonica]
MGIAARLLPGCVILNGSVFVLAMYVQIRKEPPLSFLLVLLEGKLPSERAWDELTLSQQRRQTSTLPVLWADHATFVQALENHTGSASAHLKR